MDTQILPATAERFDDVETMLGPKRGPDAIACWCLTYRLGSRSIRQARCRREEGRRSRSVLPFAVAWDSCLFRG